MRISSIQTVIARDGSLAIAGFCEDPKVLTWLIIAPDNPEDIRDYVCYARLDHLPVVERGVPTFKGAKHLQPVRELFDQWNPPYPPCKRVL